MDGSRLTAGRAALVFALATVVFTWPQVRHLTWVPDNVDSFFSMWRLGWIAHVLPAHPGQLFDANIFYPHRDTLAFSDAVLLEGAVAAPWLWLHAPTPVVYNLLVLATFPLCGLAMFVLVRDLTASAPAGFLSGLVFAFAPFRFDHYYHLELLWSMWMPLAFLMLHRAVRSGRLRDGLATGLIVALQGFSSIYYVIFLGVALGLAALVLLLGRPTADSRRAFAALAAGAVLAGVLLAPYALQYLHARADVGDRDLGTALLYGAGPKHYLAPMPDSLLYGRLLGSIGRPEKRLFFGFVALALAAAAFVGRPNRIKVVYLAVLAMAVDGSFGLRGFVMGWLWAHAALFRGLRVPGRFGEVALMAVAVLAGIGAAALLARLDAGRPRLARWSAPALAAAMCLEFLAHPLALVPAATSPTAIDAWLASERPGVVAEFPMPRLPYQLTLDDAKFEYASTFHWHPLVNGYSGNLPDSYFNLLKAEASFPAPDAIDALHTAGVTYIVVHRRDFPDGRFDDVVRALDARPDLIAYGRIADGDSTAAAYRFRDRP